MSESNSRRTTLRLIIAATLAASALGLSAVHAATPAYDPAPSAEVDGLKAKFIDVAGQRTRYYEYGQGEPLLLIHGGGRGTTSSANNFSPVIALLAKRYHVIAFDKSAAGMTDNPKDDDDLSYQGEVKHTYNLIQTLKLGPSHVVGHSSGGAVAFYLAVEHPDIVKTLTIVARMARKCRRSKSRRNTTRRKRSSARTRRRRTRDAPAGCGCSGTRRGPGMSRRYAPMRGWRINRNRRSRVRNMQACARRRCRAVSSRSNIANACGTRRGATACACR
jgi:pimeloyl-ACP methyl ester carboxylesterase